MRLTFDQLSARLVSCLDTVEPALRIETIAAVTDLFEAASSVRGGMRRVDRALNESDTFYVVHDADLELLKVAVSVAVSFVPFFKPATALPALVALLFRYRRKRARIDAEQAAVLLCLRSAPPGGLTARELTHRLTYRTAIAEARALQILNSLRGLLLDNGDRSDFVVRSGDVWTALDV